MDDVEEAICHGAWKITRLGIMTVVRSLLDEDCYIIPSCSSSANRAEGRSLPTMMSSSVIVP